MQIRWANQKTKTKEPKPSKELDATYGKNFRTQEKKLR